MAKTTNLGLNLTTDDSTEFEVWRESIDGNNEISDKSNMQIIDEFAGDVVGKNGTFTLLANSWVNSSQSVSIPILKNTDLLTVVGATQADQDLLSAAQLFGTTNNGSVSFISENVPTSNITVKYFISKGV